MTLGQKVEHILSGDWLTVLEIKNNKILCRSKDYREIWFYDFELKIV